MHRHLPWRLHPQEAATAASGRDQDGADLQPAVHGLLRPSLLPWLQQRRHGRRDDLILSQLQVGKFEENMASQKDGFNRL